MAPFEREVERLLLLREILPDDPERFRMLAELAGERARVGLGRGRKAPSVATCEAMPPSARWNSSTRAASPL